MRSYGKMDLMTLLFGLGINNLIDSRNKYKKDRADSNMCQLFFFTIS